MSHQTHESLFRFLFSFLYQDFPGGSDGKASAYNAGDLGSIPGSGRSIQVSQSAGYCNHMLFIRRMDQEEYTDTVECYSAMKKDKVMPYAETRTDLQIFTLSEVSQAEKEKCRMTSLIRGI